MAFRPKRIFAWMLVTACGSAVCGVSRLLSPPTSGLVLLVGLIVGLCGVAGARLNTDWYNQDR